MRNYNWAFKADGFILANSKGTNTFQAGRGRQALLTVYNTGKTRGITYRASFISCEKHISLFTFATKVFVGTLDAIINSIRT